MRTRHLPARFAIVTAVVAAVSGAVPIPAADQGTPPEAEDRTITLPEAASGAEGWSVSEPFRIDGGGLVGVDFVPGMEVELRTMTEGRWGEWLEVEPNDQEGPDEGSVEGRQAETAPSIPVWVGEVEQVQLRSTGRPISRVPVHVVAMTGGDGLEWTPAPEAPLGTAPANAAPDVPQIVTRSQWNGGTEPWHDSRVPSYASDVRFAVVHHTVNSNSYACSESDDIVRAIHRYHTATNGWWDIGYNFLIDRCGTVFEGRYGGVDKPVIGSHTGGFNTGATGVSLIGTFSNTEPPSAMVDGLRRFLAWKLDLHGVDPLGTTTETAGNDYPGRWQKGDEVVLNAIIGHRDTKSTDCPGDGMYARISNGSLAKEVAALGGPKLYTDQVAYVQLNRSDTLSFQATPSELVTYRVDAYDVDGRRIRVASGKTDKAFTVRWALTNELGLKVPYGNYRLLVNAVDSKGRAARPLEVAVAVVADAPQGDPNATPVRPPAGATLVTGDWDGDGIDTPGWFKDGKWGLHDRSHAQGNTRLLSYGQAGDKPVVGDWDGDGVDTIGVVRGNLWILRNEYRRGAEDILMRYGQDTDKPVTGDWDGDGIDTLGVVRGNLWILRSEYKRGADDVVMTYGKDTDTPVTGDWDADGVDTLGVVRDNLFILRSVYKRGADDVVMRYGYVTDLPVTGDWNGDDRDTLGVVRDSQWILRSHYRSDATDYVFMY